MTQGVADVAGPAAEKRSPQTWLTLARSATSSWLDDYAPSMGAALSYYTVFSLAPLLLIVVSVAGLVFGVSDFKVHRSWRSAVDAAKAAAAAREQELEEELRAADTA